MAPPPMSNPAKVSVPHRLQEPDAVPGSSLLTEFTLFSNLTIELRLKIWAFCLALQEPRTVEVRTQRHNCDDHKRDGFCPRYSPTRVPTILHVCHEARTLARKEALRVGNLCFLSPEPAQRSSSSHSPPWKSDIGIFFNPETDRLYLPAEDGPWINKGLQDLSHLLPGWQAPRPITPHRATAFFPGPLPVSYTVPVPVRRKPPSALSQFTQLYQCPRVRSLIADLDINTLRVLPTVNTAAPAANAGAEGLVRTVMALFRNLEDVIFVVQESRFTHQSVIRMMKNVKEALERDRERHANELELGHVQWRWPRVRLAIRVWRGGWRLVELEGEVLVARARASANGNVIAWEWE